MKNKRLLYARAFKAVMTALLIGVSCRIYAYDFSAVCSTGQTLYYNITDATNHYVELTCPGSQNDFSCWKDYTKPIGNIVLPSYVTYNGITYLVKGIGSYAFNYCTGLIGNLNIPNTVTYIGSNAFEGCKFSGCLVIPSSLIGIGEEAFRDCSDFSELILLNGILYIHEGTFYGCKNLTSITIPESVTSIDNGAFGNCSRLSSITVYAETPPRLEYGIFLGVNRDIPVHVPCGTALAYKTQGTHHVDEHGESDSWREFKNLHEDGDCLINFADATVKNICVSHWDTNGDGKISVSEAEAVTDLGTLFWNSGGISSFDELHYFTGLTSIHQSAFWHSGLTSIIIPNTVTTIEEMAFQGCSNLTSITIPGSVTTIEGYAFQHCTSLTSINIPYSVNYIGYLALDDTGWLNSQPNGIVYLGSDWCIGYKGTKPSGALSINYTRGIASNAFDDCSSITSVSLPSTLKYINGGAFAGCSNITSIKIPNSVISIGYNAFMECRQLASITLSNSLKCIGAGAFNQCTSLTSVNIPNSVDTMGWGVFYFCTNLVSASLSNSLSYIPSTTFEDCSSLTSITIPSSIESIEHHAFYNCNNLAVIMMKGTTPPVLEYSTVFEGTACPIYVPYESLNTYKTATNWSTYASRIYPWMQTTIPGYGTSNGKWAFIASPLTNSTAPTAIDDMIATTVTKYDLYRFNQAGVNGEWENYKVHGFDLTNGQGYLYANKSNVNLVFKGDFNENTTQVVPLSYVSGTRFAGYNLVGNPFPVNAYSSRPYYVMNADGDAVIATAISTNEPIAPCTGVIVQAMENENNPTVTFSTTAPSTSNKGNLNIMLCEVDTRRGTTGREAFIDNAIVSFNEGDQLGKFVFNEDNAKLYIPQNGKEYAIVCVGDGRDAMHCVSTEVPVNFKATRNGEYTLTVNPESVEMEYLHLIDNLTGSDVDLLVSPSYTFTAKTDDYASRFRLVFSANDDNENNNDFAFISDGEIHLLVETCHGASLQVIDALGRIIKNVETSYYGVSIDGMTPGVYVLRLVNGENMKTQKIVIK